MTEQIRQQALDALRTGWGAYVERFQRLPPEAQATWLANQGFARFADLLVHVTAWWTEGKQAIENLRDDPAFVPPEFDVDAFNAQAVERTRAVGELEVIRSFEAMRAALIELVTNLPESAFQNPRLVDRLHIEVIGHLAEHEMPAGAA